MRTQTQKTQDSAKADPVRSSRTSTPQYSHPVLQLQQQLGNQAVQRLLQSGHIQAKLTIGQPNDKYEQEADRVADQVMRMPDHVLTNSNGEMTDHVPPKIQRLCPEHKERIKRDVLDEDKEEEEDKLLQAKVTPGHTPQVTPDISNNIQSLKGGGQSLTETTRSFFEPRLGMDLSAVRVHTDTRAADTAQAVNAKAFTWGNNIVFGAGHYQPQSNAGKHLLAHELVHVGQQSGANTSAARYPAIVPYFDIERVSPLSVMRQEEERAPRQEDGGPGFWGTVAGGLMGEFNEDPNVAMVGMDVGVSLVPILDQASDIRDVVAHLYYLIVRRQYDRFMRWLGLVFTLIGLIPELGSAIKGASKFIIKGVQEVISRLADILRFVRRFLPDISDISRLRNYVVRNWDRIVAGAIAAWNRTVNRVRTIVHAVPGFLSRRIQFMHDGLARITDMAPAKMHEAFAWIRRKWDEVLEAVEQRLGRRRGGGPGEASADVDEAVEQAFSEGRVSSGELTELIGHGSAREARQARGVSGRQVESAHGAPQSAMRGVTSYDPDAALTRLMPRGTHRAMDRYWQQEARRLVDQGRSSWTAEEMIEAVSESIRRTPGLTNAEKFSHIQRLSDEVFVEFGLNLTDLVRLPFS